MTIFLIFNIVLVLARICWSDIKYRIITNKIILLLLLLILPYAYFSYGEIFVLNSLITLVLGFLLFSLNVIGAGDVKLLAVLMLAIPSQLIIAFLFFISFFGFLLIIIGWVFFRQNIKTQGLPYGVAISCGFLLTVWGLN